MSRFTVPANPNDPNPRKRFTHTVEVILGSRLENSYDAAGKEYPKDLPDTWADPNDKKDKRITWFSNFGLTDKNGHFVHTMPAGSSYTARLPKLSGTYVYFDGAYVQKLNTTPSPDNANTVDAIITLADPPVGMV